MDRPGLGALKRALTVKRAFLRMLESRLTRESIGAARGDSHAKRAPRPCGLTVHTCIGCPYTCTYCYIDDMGFKHGESSPYALRPDEWLYAVLSNPAFMPGELGTYLAFGSVSEPLYGRCGERALGYLERVGELGNPCQVATKYPVDEELASKLARAGRGSLNVLVTIVTLRLHRKLEPGAPSPEERVEAIRQLSRAGVPTFIFLRPLIPGVNVDEVEAIVEEGRRAGAIGVVLGGFRVSERIMQRMERVGIDLSEVRRRLPSRWGGRRMVEVAIADLKREAASIVAEKGLVPLYSACCATTLSRFLVRGVRAPCAGLCFIGGRTCSPRCPVRCREVVGEVSRDEVVEAFKLAGAKVDDVEVEGLTVRVKARGVDRRLLALLSTAFRRRFLLAA